MSPWSRRFDPRNLVLLLAACAICFVGAEWAIRRSGITDRLGWQMVLPIAERVDRAPAKQPGEVRIVGLGDSFTVFRDGQGRNYLRYAESLARRAGFPARVVNLAQSGFGIADYFDVFESYGAALGADVAVFGLYLGNDIFPSDGPTLRVRYREERLRSTRDQPASRRCGALRGG